MSRLPPSVLERWDMLSARERRLIFLGAVAVLLFVLYMLLRGAGEEVESGVELAAAPPAALSSPMPVAPLPAAVPPPPPAAPAVAPTSLMLYGVVGGGTDGGSAILGPAGGKQRLVRIGRPAAPGATLKEVGASHAVLATASGDVRLELIQLIPPAVPAAPQ